MVICRAWSRTDEVAIGQARASAVTRTPASISNVEELFGTVALRTVRRPGLQLLIRLADVALRTAGTVSK
jgi:hypothetical protein